MEFVKVGRDDLIQHLKEYIELLKKCPRDMEFHTCMEFCGIDKGFLKIAKQYNENKMKQQISEQKRLQEEKGNI